MQNIHVKRYKNPEAVGYQGWLEPEDLSWIAFIDLEGKPVFYLHRDPVTGGVLDPLEATSKQPSGPSSVPA